MELVLHILELGLIYVPVVLAVFLTSRVIRLDDLTLEGSFNLGGSLGACLLTLGLHPLLATLGACVGGALSGMTSGLIHTRLGIHHLISGLAMSGLLYSLSLKLVGAHKVLAKSSSLFDLCEAKWLVLSVVVLIVVGIMLYLLTSEVGLHLKAVGSNPRLLTFLAKDSRFYQVLGLTLANSLSALSGMLFVQWLGFYAITNYVGTWIAGLNGLMMSELIPSLPSVGWVVGSILNQVLFAAILELNIDPLWNQALKAILVIVLLRALQERKRLGKKRSSHVAA